MLIIKKIIIPSERKKNFIKMNKKTEIEKIYGVGTKTKKIITQKVGLNKRIYYLKIKKNNKKKINIILSNFNIGPKLKSLVTITTNIKKKQNKHTPITYKNDTKKKKNK